MNTQLWVATHVPLVFPDFVNPRHTPDSLNYQLIYIFELYVNHPLFSRCKTPDNKAKKYLRYYKFESPKRIYQGLRSEVFLKDDAFPPRLSVECIPGFNF
jgi:hypothetical protein